MADVNTTLAQLQQYGVDTTQLSTYLNGLSSDQQTAALAAIQSKMDAGHVTTAADMNTTAQQAVEQSDPVSQLSGGAFGGLVVHTSWSQDQLTALKQYFATDPVLKNDSGMQQRVIDQLKKTKGQGDPVDQAKGIAWGQMSLQQRAQYGYQPGDIKNLDDLKKAAQQDAPFDTNVNWSPLETYINKLSGADKYAALQIANQNLSGAFGGITGTQAAIDKALVAVTNQQNQQTQAASTASAAAAPATGAAAISQIVPDPNSPTVSDAVKQQYKLAMGGQDFDQAYKNFADNYAISVEQQNAQGAGVAGTEQLWNSGNYVAPAAGYTYGSPVPNTDPSKRPTEAQFLGMQSQSTLKLANAILAAADTTAQGTYGNHLDAGLQAQILSQIGAMPLDAQISLAANPAGAEAAGGALDIGAMLSTYAAKNPSWVKSVSAAADTTAYNLQQAQTPSPVPGMQMGAYDKLVSTMRPIWEAAFKREPTPAELQHFAGWDPNELQGWANSQPSLDNPGMTVGERTSYITAADKASQAFFGTPADSRMVDILHGHFNPDAAPPTVTPPAATPATTQPAAPSASPTPASAAKPTNASIPKGATP